MASDKTMPMERAFSLSTSSTRQNWFAAKVLTPAILVVCSLPRSGWSRWWRGVSHHPHLCFANRIEATGFVPNLDRRWCENRGKPSLMPPVQQPVSPTNSLADLSRPSHGRKGKNMVAPTISQTATTEEVETNQSETGIDVFVAFHRRFDLF